MKGDIHFFNITLSSLLNDKKKNMSLSIKPKTNILYIIDYLHEMGGTERHLLYLLELLDKDKYNCFVLAFDTGKTTLTESITELGVNIEHVPVGRYYTYNALCKAFRIAAYIREKRIEIVHTFHFKSDFYGAIVARMAGVKHIISSKRDNADFKKRIQFFFNRCVRFIVSKYIAVSEEVKSVIHTKEKVKRKNIVVIYNGVDFKKFYPPTVSQKINAKKALGFTENDLVIGTVAWMRQEKDHHTLFKSFMQAREDIPELKLSLVGGGPLLEEYKSYIQKQNIEEHVHFSGPVNDVRPYLHAFDIACLVPSCNEGFSNSIIEKMATGLPIIATDVGGNAEAVVDGDNGFVIPPKQVQALTNAISSLCKNTERRKSMGMNSAVRVNQEFSLSRMIENHENLYFSLIKS